MKQLHQAPKRKDAKTITIPSKVTYQGVTYKVTAVSANACNGMKKLTKVTIGANVKTIGKNAFKNCKKLKTLKIKSSKLKSVGKNAFKGIYKKCKIKVPSKKVKAYKKLMKGKGQKSTVKITK